MDNLHSPSRKKRNRRKVGLRNYKNYTDEMLDLAVDMVDKKMLSSRDAEKQLGIPRRTILNKIKKKHMKPVGGQKKLSDKEEEKLVKVLIAAGEFGSPMTKLDLKMVVHKYCEKNSCDIFNGKLPSSTWVASFLERHKSKLTNRTTQNIKKVRAEKTIKEIEDYFENLDETLKDVPPENILNYDETNLSDNTGDTKCIFRRGIKYPERILNTSKSCISIMFTISAAGYCLPTYVVYKSTNIYSEWVEGGPTQTRYNCTKSGWFDSATFEDYFKTIILEWAKKLNGPKVIIGDNLSSHLNVDVIELCQEHNIRFVFLPPNSTHLTQPLDVAFFAPLKREWKKILLAYKIQNPTQTTLNKKHFPKLLNQLMQVIKIKEKEIIKSGFRATGVFPVNARSVLKRIPEYSSEQQFSVESALIDYLKESRSPNPMAVKRAKKLQTEPGKSVSLDDILKPRSETPDTEHRHKKEKQTRIKRKIVKKHEKNEIVKSGNIIIRELIDKTETKAAFKKNQKDIARNSEFQLIIVDDIISELELSESIQEKEPLSAITDNRCGPKAYNPKSLNGLCVKVINNFLTITAHRFDTPRPDIVLLNKNLKNDPQNIRFCANRTDHLPKVLQSHMSQENKGCPSTSKVIITSDEKVDIKKISKLICTPKNKGINYINGPPVILNSLQTKIVGKESGHKSLARKYIKNKNASSTHEANDKKNRCVNTEGKKCKPTPIKEKKSRKNYKLQKKSKKYVDSSSDDSDDSDLQMSFAESDNSDCNNYESYIMECLGGDQEEKENFDPDPDIPNVPFGISDIDFCDGETNHFKENDWIVVKFVTKKSVKHFVGQVLQLENSIPTVKFLRKVNNTKGNKLIFTYPHVEDVCKIKHTDDIVFMLPQPTVSRRGQMTFDVKLNNFNIQ